MMKLYTSNDMAKIACDNCQGCFSCCQGMGDTIQLNPYDISELCQNLGKTFEELLQGPVELQVQEGMILPNLKMTGANQQCYFLNEEGRCKIHAFRPGLCRLFPLGRNYEDGKFQYFVVEDGCPKEHKTKVKIHKWLGVPNLKRHEEFLCSWHYFVKDFQEKLTSGAAAGNPENASAYIRQQNTLMLQRLFLLPYDPEADFYEQVAERMNQVR